MPGLYTEPTSRAPADARPGVRQVPHQRRPARAGGHGALLRVPGQLPQRPEPDRGDRPRGRHEAPTRSRRARTATASPTSGRASAATSRSRARASTPTTWSSRPATRRRATAAPTASAPRRTSAIRADRADGFVLKNVKVRHAKEHGIYVLESDGYLLTHFKAYYNGLYGTLTFVEDHGVHAALRRRRPRRLGRLPGRRGRDRRAAARRAPSSVTTRRSGSATCTTTWRATRAPTATPSTSTTTGSTTTRWASRPTSSPAPGTPATRATRCSSRTTSFYSNNFNVYEEDSTVKPGVPVPGRHRPVDRRRQPPPDPQQLLLRQLAPRDDALQRARPAGLRRRAPAATSRPAATPTARPRPSTTATTTTTWASAPDGTADPNGIDFWWDPYPGTVGNCWWDNTPAPGSADHHLARRRCPSCDNGTEPEQSVGTGNPAQTGELLELRRGVRDAQLRPERPVPVVQDAARAAARRRPGRAEARARPRSLARRSRPDGAAQRRGLDRPPRATSAACRAPTGTPRATRAARGSSGRSTEFVGGVGRRRGEGRRLRRHAHRPSRPTTCSTPRAATATRRASCSTSSTRTPRS